MFKRYVGSLPSSHLQYFMAHHVAIPLHYANAYRNTRSVFVFEFCVQGARIEDCIEEIHECANGVWLQLWHSVRL